MRERPDPLVPVLGSAVAVVVVGAIAFIFYPKISRMMEDHQASVIGMPPSPTARVPVWIGHTEDGVALMLEARGLDSGKDKLLDDALEGGPYRYLTLRVYNFGSDRAFRLKLPAAGCSSPEGGPAARPAAALVRENLPAHLKTVLHGYGAVSELEVAKGRRGQALLVIKADPASRTAFYVDKRVQLSRKELERKVLASWQQRPDWKAFRKFY